jgi:hypothetical protein
LSSLIETCQASQARFVGAVTNAPGNTSIKEQNVRAWLRDHQASDSIADINATHAALRQMNGNKVADGIINGFFMFGTRQAWEAVSFDKMGENNSNALGIPGVTSTGDTRIITPSVADGLTVLNVPAASGNGLAGALADPSTGPGLVFSGPPGDPPERSPESHSNHDRPGELVGTPMP